MTYAYRLAMIRHAVRSALLGLPAVAELALAEGYRGIGDPGPGAIATLRLIGSIRQKQEKVKDDDEQIY